MSNRIKATPTTNFANKTHILRRSKMICKSFILSVLLYLVYTVILRLAKDEEKSEDDDEEEAPCQHIIV